MIKAIILDVDGVIVGDKKGINFPNPPTQIIQKFKQLHEKGYPVVLCTAKFNLGIAPIIQNAKLNNPHITDGGALISNMLQNKVLKKYSIDKTTVRESITVSLQNDIYIEVFTQNGYFVQKSQVTSFTNKRSALLINKPTVVPSLFEVVHAEDIIKMITFAKNEQDMIHITDVFSRFDRKLTRVWSHHPYISPARPYILTAPNVSKEHAAREVMQRLGIGFDEVLGIGDTYGDWRFMQLCKYVATLENGDPEIKKAVRSRDIGHYFVGPHIDDLGILSIFNYFSLN